MKSIFKTEDFDDWLRHLKDRQARARILARLDRVAVGNVGDVKSVGSGVSEMRIDCGPGYRIYFCNRGTTIVVLLCGGDKSTQKNDIKKAIRLADEWEKNTDE